VSMDLKFQDIYIPNFTQSTVIVFGQKGAGKSTFVGLMGRHLDCKMIILDPVDSKPMQSEQFYKLTVTQPLNKETVKFLHEHDKIIVNLSGLTQPDLVDWSEQFFSIKWQNMSIIVDEAHFIAPQQGGVKSEKFLKFAKVCRNYNTNLTVTSQRPQSLSKEVVALGDYYVIGRVVYPLDRKICMSLIEPFFTKEELPEQERRMQNRQYLEFLVVSYKND